MEIIKLSEKQHWMRNKQLEQQMQNNDEIY